MLACELYYQASALTGEASGSQIKSTINDFRKTNVDVKRLA